MARTVKRQNPIGKLHTSVNNALALPNSKGLLREKPQEGWLRATLKRKALFSYR